jgi:uncharacterized membrane protein
MTSRIGDVNERRGTVTAIVAILLPVMIGVTAISLDGGLLYLLRRQAQSVTDAAALAGADTLHNGSRFSAAVGAQVIAEDLTFSGAASISVNDNSSVASTASLGTVQ